MQEYRPTPHGLFVSRAFVDHPRIRHWEAHLLPSLSLVVCRYDFHREREHDFYLDIAQIHEQDGLWEVRDFYLDIVVHAGLGAEILDTDELLGGHGAGYLSDQELYRAVTVAHATLADLRRARYDLGEWAAFHGLELSWRSVPGSAPPQPV